MNYLLKQEGTLNLVKLQQMKDFFTFCNDSSIEDERHFVLT